MTIISTIIVCLVISLIWTDEIIRALGGITRKAYDNLQETTSNELKRYQRAQFRKGDTVYITGESRFDPILQYILRRQYNGDTYWYVQCADDRSHFIERESVNGVRYSSLSFTPPPTCKCCGKPFIS